MNRKFITLCFLLGVTCVFASAWKYTPSSNLFDDARETIAHLEETTKNKINFDKLPEGVAGFFALSTGSATTGSGTTGSGCCLDISADLSVCDSPSGSVIRNSVLTCSGYAATGSGFVYQWYEYRDAPAGYVPSGPTDPNISRVDANTYDCTTEVSDLVLPTVTDCEPVIVGQYFYTFSGSGYVATCPPEIVETIVFPSYTVDEGPVTSCTDGLTANLLGTTGATCSSIQATCDAGGNWSYDFTSVVEGLWTGSGSTGSGNVCLPPLSGSGSCGDCNIDVIFDEFTLSDPCECNNDQGANGAMDGTFMETIGLIANDSDGNPLTGLSLCVGDGTNVPTDIAFTDNGDGTYTLIFDHLDGNNPQGGYCIETIVDCNTGNVLIGSVGIDVICNVCYYPIIDASISDILCIDSGPVVINSSVLNDPPADGVGTFDGDFTYTGTGVTGNLFDPSAAGPGSHTITVDYLPQNVVGTGTGSMVCSTSLDLDVTVIGAPEAPMANNGFHCIGKDPFAAFLTAMPAPCAAGQSTLTWFDENGVQLHQGLEFNPIIDGGINPNVAACYTFLVASTCIDGNGTGCTGATSRVTFEMVECNLDCNSGCTYFLVLEDSEFNGWDNAKLTVSINEAWPATEYKLGSGCNAGYDVIPLQINDGATIDVAYWQGAFEAEHAWQLLDWSGTPVIANGVTYSTGYDDMGKNTIEPDLFNNDESRVKANCPTCCTGEDEYIVRITLGINPEHQSWEIYDGYASNTTQGSQVIGINGQAYTGFEPGTQFEYPITLDKCNSYTFHAFDGFNDGWNSVAGDAAWEIISADPTYGNTILDDSDPYFGYQLVMSNDATLPFYADAPCVADEVVVGVELVAIPSFSGALTADDPTFNRPFVSAAGCAGSGVGLDVTYDILCFSVDIADTYNFEVTSFTDPNEDSFLALYENGFDPNNPCNNLIATGDDGGEGFLSLLVSPADMGNKYTLVITTYSDGQLGTYDLEISSDNGGLVLIESDIIETEETCSDDYKTITMPCVNCATDPIVVSGADGDCNWFGSISVNEPYVCYPECSHGICADGISERIIIWPHGNPADAFEVPEVDFTYTNGVRDVALTSIEVGCHVVIQEITYCDGIVTNCIRNFNVTRDANPAMVCNDLIHFSLVNDSDDCETVVSPDDVLEMPNFCEGEYIVTLVDADGNEIGNVVDGSHTGQTFTYVVEHKFSGNKCWGEITIEDKLAPYINCESYVIPCNHPDALEENYTHTDVYEPAAEMPANIPGGVGIAGQSNTWIPINTECTSMGEILQNISVSVIVNHPDPNELQIFLHSPSTINVAPIQLADLGEVADTNSYTLVSTDPLNPFLMFTGAQCADLATEIAEDFITENSGAATPSNLGNTWYIQVVDAFASTDDGVEANGGEVLSANITLTCGFPSPILSAHDCSEFDIDLLSEVIHETDCDQSEWLGAIIKRTWQAIDVHGNSTTCVQEVGLRAPMFSDLIWPEDIEAECSLSFEPEATGLPGFGCFPIDSTMHGICDVVYTYEDNVFELCGSGKKIIRTWTVLNCCTYVSKDHVQTIILEDKTGPVIDADAIFAGTGDYDCSGSIAFNEAVTDSCSAIQSIIVRYFVGGSPYIPGSQDLVIVNVTNGETITDLPFGTTNITIIATDECLNVSEVTVPVTIADTTPPIVVCDDELRVSLGGSGEAWIPATSVDEGSYDNCGDITIAVRRVGGCLGTSGWSDSAPVACCDIGIPLIIEMRVTDAAGNTNICWDYADVEDPLPPVITTPENKEIYCDDPALHDPLGEATATDNCSATVTYTDVEDLDNCNAGTIIRTFVASDGSDKSPDVGGTQTITVLHRSDFTVLFPDDVTISSCPDDIGATGEPIIVDDDCELVAQTHKDQVLTIADDACYKILRTWTLVNWCVYNEGDPYTALGDSLGVNTYQDDDGYFEYVQEIKVLDDVAPVIECPTESVTYTDLTDGCEGPITLDITANDGCSGEADLNYTIKIDLGNDGSIDIIEDLGNFNSYQLNQPDSYGNHSVKWVVSDGCGNESNCEYPFVIEDGKNPTPVCLNGVSTTTMNIPSGGCVTLWASDLLEYAFDNCSSDEYVENSVRIRKLGSSDAPTPNLTLCCGDIPNGSVETIQVEVWVWDEAGNSDYCATYIILQDNANNCDDVGGTAADIAGHIETEYGDMVEDVMVEVTGGMNSAYPTGTGGGYAFPNVPTGQNYTITPEKDINPLNGVSTFDLVLMSKHILGTTPLTSPYQLIAADVNNNNDISTFDIVLTRQMILFIITDFPSNTSWRFVDMDYAFPDPTDPWTQPFPEVIDYQSLNNDELLTDFIGIKIGDVSGDAFANQLMEAEERNDRRTLYMEVDEAELTNGQTYTVDFRAKDFTNISGYQFTLGFDQTAMTFAGINAGELAIAEGNFGLTLLDQGVITTSYNTTEAISIADDAVLFSITFEATGTVNTAEALNITSRYTSAEGYTDDGEQLEVGLAINTTNGVVFGGDKFELYQNRPNPFSESTVVGFYLPEATTATLTVFDVSGKLLRVVEGDYTRGYNEVIVDQADLQGSGVLYYKLDTPTDSETMKMILLD